MAIEIKEVLDKADLNKFVKFPYQLYMGNKYWIPPLFFDEMNTLRRDKNPAFEFCEAKYWLVFRDGIIAGRIAGILNQKFVEKWDHKYLRFGWIDFIDDEQVAKSLLDTVENWARSKGMAAVHGPLGFTDMDNEGTLIEGFEEIGTLATIYNYPYYPKHIERCGYKKDADWVEFAVKPPQKVPEVIKRIAERTKEKNNLTVLKINKAKELLPYAKEIFEVLNIAYKDLYGFVQLSEKQIDMYVKQYFGFIRPEYVPVVLDSKGKVAAFGITMPSLSKALQKARGRLFPLGFFHILRAMRKNDRADLYLVAVRPDLQDKGVNAILIHEMNKTFLKAKIVEVESNPELESNLKVQAQWKLMEKRQHKKRRCYIKYLH
jgi:hypothetical protein